MKKTKLYKTLEELQNLLNDENYTSILYNAHNYEKDSWNTFSKAYQNAQAILKKENLSEQDIPDITTVKTNLYNCKG
ncbi:MAG: hypothetical protein V8S53_00235 [Lachnospiraceae bacterium]